VEKTHVAVAQKCCFVNLAVLDTGESVWWWGGKVFLPEEALTGTCMFWGSREPRFAAPACR